MTTVDDPRPIAPRGRLARALALSWLANSCTASAIGLLYFGDRLSGASLALEAWAFAALVSSLATVLAVPAFLLWLLAVFVPRARLIGIVQSLAWSFALVLVFADTRVYALFRYHFNGMVWNLLTTPGGADTFELGAGTWIGIAVAGAVLFVLEWKLWRTLVAEPEPNERSERRRTRGLLLGAAALLVIVVGEKLAYATANVRGDGSILSLSSLFPMYQRLTMNEFLERWFHVDAKARASVEVAAGSLRYPLEKPRFPADAHDVPPRNILILVIDSLRADMLAEETMPELVRWSKGARRFENHASGGNATRFGIFSLVYGIHGTYWQSVLDEKAPPVLVTALQSLGYEMRVLSAAKMDYPEFRSTAWVTMQDAVEDRLPGKEKYDRDREVASRFETWMAERASTKEPVPRAPFFCFVLLDSPHQTYSWPPEETHFEPFVEKIDYLKLSAHPSAEDMAPVKNSYKNAVRFADGVAARMIESLRAHGELEHTIVIVTGDHGEEFMENGFYGHTSNFTPEQVHVTFVMGGPGVPAGVETRPTCHVDVAPTLLELLGADLSGASGRASWSQGESLLDPPVARERIVAGWQEVALWVDGGILRVPLEGHRGFVEALTTRWKPHPDADAFLAAHGPSMLRLARECRRFLR
jgi:membrane-anchored protein YejM (alkaline phosphatase superfamily)